jgi:flagellar biosynthesis GTPase FlhF
MYSWRKHVEHYNNVTKRQRNDSNASTVAADLTTWNASPPLSPAFPPSPPTLSEEQEKRQHEAEAEEAQREEEQRLQQEAEQRQKEEVRLICLSRCVPVLCSALQCSHLLICNAGFKAIARFHNRQAVKL